MAGLGLIFLRRGGQAHPTAGLPYIKFKDSVVAEICISRWSSDGIGLTYDDAAEVTSIGVKGSSIFSNNTNITSFDELQYFINVKSMSADWLSSVNGYDGALAGCSNMTSVKLPPNLTTVGQYSLYDCRSADIDITDSLLNVQTIGQYAFGNCYRLKGSLVAPNLTSLANNAFRYTSIEMLLDMGKITSIAGSSSGGTFYRCDSLHTAILPPTLTSLAGGAFLYCDNLSTIICKAITPPTIQNWSFNNPAVTAYYVPDASVDAYKSATNWSAYSAKIKGVSALAADNPTLYNEIKSYL